MIPILVRRNPITGEEVEICLETENDDKNLSDNKEVKGKLYFSLLGCFSFVCT